MKRLIFYIDEAGRWPLAGPVHIGILVPIARFDKTIFVDSKSISEKKRQEIFQQIQDYEKQWKLLFSIWVATNKEIDTYWIIKALNIAVKRWFINIVKKYLDNIKHSIYNQHNWDLIISWLNIYDLIEKTKRFTSLDWIHKNNIYFDIISNLKTISSVKWIILDWNNDFWLSKDFGYNITTVIKWDKKNPFIWWASIIAKVSRDQHMIQISKQYPDYKFEQHKWYWTKQHIQLLKNYWPTPIHRQSFIKKILENNV